MPILKFGDIGTISQTVYKDEDGIGKQILIKAILLDSPFGRVLLEGKDRLTPRGMPSDITLNPKSFLKNIEVDEKLKASDGYIEWQEYDDDDGNPYSFFSIDLVLDDKIFSEFWERFSRVRDLDNISISIKDSQLSETLSMKMNELFYIESYTFQFAQRKQDT